MARAQNTCSGGTSVDERIGEGLIEHSLDLLLAVTRKTEEADADAVDASSIIVGPSNDLSLGGHRPLLTAKVDCHDHLFARLERGRGLDQHSCSG